MGTSSKALLKMAAGASDRLYSPPPDPWSSPRGGYDDREDPGAGLPGELNAGPVDRPPVEGHPEGASGVAVVNEKRAAEAMLKRAALDGRSAATAASPSPTPKKILERGPMDNPLDTPFNPLDRAAWEPPDNLSVKGPAIRHPNDLGIGSSDEMSKASAEAPPRAPAVSGALVSDVADGLSDLIMLLRRSNFGVSGEGDMDKTSGEMLKWAASTSWSAPTAIRIAASGSMGLPEGGPEGGFEGEDKPREPVDKQKVPGTAAPSKYNVPGGTLSSSGYSGKDDLRGGSASQMFRNAGETLLKWANTDGYDPQSPPGEGKGAGPASQSNDPTGDGIPEMGAPSRLKELRDRLDKVSALRPDVMGRALGDPLYAAEIGAKGGRAAADNVRLALDTLRRMTANPKAARPPGKGVVGDLLRRRPMVLDAERLERANADVMGMTVQQLRQYLNK